ncbi:T9SS type A sorting domain-containing protein [Algivirga pacifica]|uniref:Secretion system C-terminal sorting domain-containing protein n=1 Tax=Algivirga pacifica TaxID=1162670 RepID=A0ABP9D418_9BACT
MNKLFILLLCSLLFTAAHAQQEPLLNTYTDSLLSDHFQKTTFYRLQDVANARVAAGVEKDFLDSAYLERYSSYYDTLRVTDKYYCEYNEDNTRRRLRWVYSGISPEYTTSSQTFTYEETDSSSVTIQLDSMYSTVKQALLPKTKKITTTFKDGAIVKTEELEWRTDMEEWIVDRVREDHYDEKGNVIFYQINIWNSYLQEVIPFVRNTYEYDQQGRYTLSRREAYYPESDFWNVLQEEWQYDTSGNLLYKAVYDNYGQSGDGLTGISKEEWEYSDGQAVLHTIYEWSESSKDFVRKERQRNVLNSYGQVEEEYLELWSWNEWVNHRKKVHAYDMTQTNSGNRQYSWDEESQEWKIQLEEEIRYENDVRVTLRYAWDTSLHTKQLSEKLEYTYKEEYDLFTEATYDWDSQQEEWVGKEKETYTFYSGSFLIPVKAKRSLLTYEWDSIQKIWLPRSRLINYILQNKEGKIVSNYTFSWNQELLEWILIRSAEYEYNEKGLLYLRNVKSYWEHTGELSGMDKITISYSASSQYLLLQNSTWDKSSDTWNVVYQETFFYSKRIVAGIDMLQDKSLLVYPNPSHHTFAIQLEDQIERVEVFNMQGKKVQEYHDKQEQYDISNQPSGQYFIRVRGKRGSYSSRLLKL